MDFSARRAIRRRNPISQPIRYPEESKGRFEPVEMDTWIKTFAIPVLEHDEGHAADWTKENH